MILIVGLGNPGRDYQLSRHNMGYLTLDILADRHNIDIRRHNFRSVFGEGRIGAQKVVLAKPETYMNNSGWAVRDLVNWYKTEPGELILIYDDTDLPAGDIRVREGGSSGTHNGMRSVIYHLCYDNFPRVRVGIGSPPPGWDMAAYVLSYPVDEEREALVKSLNAAADAVEMIVKGDIKDAQAWFNKKAKKEPAGGITESRDGEI